MANLRSADEEGIVVEMIKHANIVFKEDLLKKMNQGFQKLSFDESWHIADDTQGWRFQRISKFASGCITSSIV